MEHVQEAADHPVPHQQQGDVGKLYLYLVQLASATCCFVETGIAGDISFIGFGMGPGHHVDPTHILRILHTLHVPHVLWAD